MPKQHDHNTGQEVHLRGINLKKLKPLVLQKDTPLLMPIWTQLTASSRAGRGVVRTFSTEFNGMISLEIVETGFNSDVWEIRMVTGCRKIRNKNLIHGVDTAKFKAAHWATEKLLRAAYAANELVNQSIPF